ncbi:MAG: hypothetical protein N3I35_12025 [Clostridia bacterium]|nr:hypothetical protein [Clostridia bacterium]
MNFGKVTQCMLFGGGQLLSELALKLVNEGFKVLVVTSERHSEELICVDETHLSLKNFLIEKGINYVVSSNVNNDNAVISRITDSTIGISMGAAWIFRTEFINHFGGRLVNLHGTRLPQDRGGGGFSWRILRSERLGYSIIHQIDPGVDTGDIIKYKEYFYPPSCRLPVDYQNYTIKQYHILLEEFFNEIISGMDFHKLSQQEYLSEYWPRLSTDLHGYIDWSWRLRDIEQFICAFDDPYRGASTFINGIKVRVKSCFSSTNDGVFHPFQKGIVYRISAGALFVATEDGTLIIKSVSTESGEDFIKQISVGDRLYTPLKYIEDAKLFRAIYTPTGLKK